MSILNKWLTFSCQDGYLFWCSGAFSQNLQGRCSKRVFWSLFQSLQTFTSLSGKWTSPEKSTLACDQMTRYQKRETKKELLNHNGCDFLIVSDLQNTELCIEGASGYLTGWIQKTRWFLVSRGGKPDVFSVSNLVEVKSFVSRAFPFWDLTYV